MKKLLLSVFALSVLTTNAQNILDQKVTFRYTQLPILNIGGPSKDYSVDVKMGYLQRNEDSLKAYEAAKTNFLIQIENTIDNWEQEKARIDKQHLVNLVTWEKQVAAGNATAVAPVKAPYPPLLIPDRPKKPFVLEEINTKAVADAVRIEGLKQNPSAGAKITLIFDGFEKGMVKLDTKGTGALTKYEYQIQYRHPVTLKIELPGKGEVVNQRIAETESFRTYRTKDFKSKSELDLWWYENEQTVWQERQKQVALELMDNINYVLSDRYGFPERTRKIEVYSVKSNKDHDYSDYQKAYKTMESALLMLAFPAKKAEANGKFREAISVWENALKESNINDKKARVDKTVTAATYVNLAEAYLWLSDFSNAEIMANQAINVGVNKYEKDGRALLEFIRVMRERYQANQ